MAGKVKSALLIAGLPASGKTTYAKMLQTKVAGSILIDDPKIFEYDVHDVLNTDGVSTVFVTDPYFCMPLCRIVTEEKFRSFGFEVSWIFFKNDVKACKQNFIRRHGTEKSSNNIDFFSKRYVIPENAIVLPVWK